MISEEGIFTSAASPGLELVVSLIFFGRDPSRIEVTLLGKSRIGGS